MVLNNQRVVAQTKEVVRSRRIHLKMIWVKSMNLMSDVITKMLGPRITADTGEWGTYEWNEHLLGAPGYRIAGGSDEIQRNIVGERVLGLLVSYADKYPLQGRTEIGICHRATDR